PLDRRLHDLLLRAYPHLGLTRGFVLLPPARLRHRHGCIPDRRAPDAARRSRRRRNPGGRVHHGARLMVSFQTLVRTNPNYRYTWIGQVVSEIGDHFNNIAVFSLALANTRSGLVVSGVMISRAVPAVLAGPIAGVLLDRMDRKRVMIASDLIRAF